MSREVRPIELLGQRKIVVCVGTGGVGKTTIAATLGLEAARAGQSVLVLTIDPARRLANALGLRDLDDEPQRVAAEHLGEASSGGQLFAMMLDTKHTFDGLIARFAASEEARNQILQNPIYEHLSNALAGSGEYAAMEKVLELFERDEFDLIVVDTPPAQHALDFLDAPVRMAEFFESRLVQLLVHPAMAAGRWGFKIFQRPIHSALQLLEKVTGIEFLEDLSEFLLAIESMSSGFVERSARIRETLLGPETAFLLISGPGRQSVRSTRLFLEHLVRLDASPSGVIINRMHRWPGGGPPPAWLISDSVSPENEELSDHREILATALTRADEEIEAGRRAVEAALEAARQYAAQVRQDSESTGLLRDEADRLGAFFRAIPELSGDVHDLDGLDHIADELFRPSELATSWKTAFNLG